MKIVIPDQLDRLMTMCGSHCKFGEAREPEKRIIAERVTKREWSPIDIRPKRLIRTRDYATAAKSALEKALPKTSRLPPKFLVF